MDYVILGVGVLNLVAIGWIALTLAAAARMRRDALSETLARLEVIAGTLEAIARPSQRLGTDAQQPGDGRAALRERLALRSQRSH